MLAGKEYGTGSSRDWAAKGTMLLGVKAVITESFERIHRSNLIGMGVLPLQFVNGQTAQSLGLTGREVFDFSDLQNAEARTLTVTATPENGAPIRFEVRVRIDTPKERDYYRHGGILQYVLRQLAAPSPSAKPKAAVRKKPAAKAKVKAKAKAKPAAKRKAAPARRKSAAKKKAPTRKKSVGRKARSKK